MDVVTEAPSSIHHATVWTPGSPPRELELDGPPPADGIVWFEIDAATGEAEQLREALSARCPGLTLEMVEDLLSPDERPQRKSYGDGSVKLVSSFEVKAVRLETKQERGVPASAGVLSFSPVELLGADRWLITCWHPTRVFTRPGEAETVSGITRFTSDHFDAVARRWASGNARNGGDLGVLLLHELALTYAPAHRALYGWLEDWELGVYVEDEVDRETLAQLWSSMAVLRDWVNPLNPAGVRRDLSKAWLPATDHAQVIAVDDRVDDALRSLRELGETLRASFALLHSKQTQEQRQRSDEIQRRVEIAAAGFLIPTLVVGFYGANTWVPGQQAHWGFWVMVGVLVVLSLGGVTLVRRWHREQAAELQRAKDEQARLRARLLRERSGY